MRRHVSEGRREYEDANHGLFSRRLAEWAISNMRKEGADGNMERINAVGFDEYKEKMKESGYDIPEPFEYTGWYLYNMAIADYPKALKGETERASFVYETMFDPDGHPESVLGCFEAKMEEDGMPIYWEKYL